MAEIGYVVPDMAEGLRQGADLKGRMAEIGSLWGLGRPLRAVELGRALRTCPSEPGKPVREWLRDATTIPGPASVAVEMLALGALPPDGLGIIKPQGKRR